MPWEHFYHTADVGVRGTGSSLAEAFAEAAVALIAVITDPACVEAKTAIELTLTAEDPELLLYEWLNALIFEMAVRKLLLGSFQLTIEGNRLTARVAGEPVDPARHHPRVEVKGATLTALQVRRRKNGTWLVQCVVDV